MEEERGKRKKRERERERERDVQLEERKYVHESSLVTSSLR